MAGPYCIDLQEPDRSSVVGDQRIHLNGIFDKKWHIPCLLLIRFALNTFFSPSKTIVMLRWTVIFLVIAIVAAIFGFFGIAASAAYIAKILFFIFIVLFILSLIRGRRRIP